MRDWVVGWFGDEEDGKMGWVVVNKRVGLADCVRSCVAQRC